MASNHPDTTETLTHGSSAYSIMAESGKSRGKALHYSRESLQITAKSLKSSLPISSVLFRLHASLSRHSPFTLSLTPSPSLLNSPLAYSLSALMATDWDYHAGVCEESTTWTSLHFFFFFFFPIQLDPMQNPPPTVRWNSVTLRD